MKRINFSLLTVLFLVFAQLANAECVSFENSSTQTLSTTGTFGEYNLNSTGGTVTFQSRRETIWFVSGNSNFHLYQYYAGSWHKSTFINLPNKNTWYSFNVTLNSATTKVKFQAVTGATGKKLIRNIKVVKPVYYTLSTTTLDFGTNTLNSSSNKTVNIAYSACEEQTVSSSNANFNISRTTVGSTCDQGSHALLVTFNPTAVGVHSGVITIGTKTVNVSGTSSLPVPTDLQASNPSYLTTDLSWNSVAGASGYEITNATTGATYSVSGENTTAYTVTALHNNTNYSYSIKSVSGAYKSNASEAVTKSTLNLTPVATAATEIANDSFVANWNVLPNVDGYKLTVFETTTNTKVLDNYSLSENFYQKKNLLLGTDYTYYVSAYVGAEVSAVSNSIAIRTTNMLPIVINESTGITADWITREGSVSTDYRHDYADGVGYSFDDDASQLTFELDEAPVSYSIDLAAYRSGGGETQSMPEFFIWASQNGTEWEQIDYWQNTDWGMLSGTAAQTVGGTLDKAYNYFKITYNDTEWGFYTTVGYLREASFTTMPTPIVSLVEVSKDEFTFNWEAVAGAEDYLIEVSAADSVLITAEVQVDRAFMALGLEQGTNYLYRVRARSGNGAYLSPFSDYKQVQTRVMPVVLVGGTAAAYTSWELGGEVDAEGTYAYGEDASISVSNTAEGTSSLVALQINNTPYSGSFSAGLSDTILVIYDFVGVARIHGNTYLSLNDAVNDSENGEIYLLEDTPLEDLDIRTEVVLNAQGFEIGDVLVAEGGHLTLSGNITLNDLVLKTTASLAEGGAQIIKDADAEVVVSGDAYLEKSISAELPAYNYWYTVAVPFEVDVESGILDTLGTPLRNGVNYLFNEFVGQNRADYGVVTERNEMASWQSVTRLLPGVGYMLTLSHSKYQHLRFKAKNADDVFNNALQVNLQEYASSTGRSAMDEGWNFIANPSLQAVSLEGVLETSFIQVLQNGGNSSLANCYVMQRVSDAVLSPSSAAFLQVSSDLVAAYEPSSSAVSVRSASSETLSSSAFLQFSMDSDPNQPATNCSFVASASASDEYVIGKDLQKAGGIRDASYVDMWTEGYGAYLSQVEVPIVNNVAQTPLYLQFPSNSTYTLALQNALGEGKLYLKKDGVSVHCLSDEAYRFAASKGQSTYTLEYLFDSNVVTSVADASANTLQAYISTDGNLVIKGLEEGESYSISTAFNTIAYGTANSRELVYPLSTKGIYIIRTSTESIKLLNK